MQAPQSTPSTPLGACGTWGPPPGVATVRNRHGRLLGLQNDPNGGWAARQSPTWRPTTWPHPVPPHSPTAPPGRGGPWGRGLWHTRSHSAAWLGLAGPGGRLPVTRSQPTDLGPGGTWEAPATAFVIRCFQLFWPFKPRCRLCLKWPEVVSRMEKTFGHLKSSRRWDLDIPRTSFVLPGIGFGTSRVRKVTLQPTRRSSCRGHAASRGSAVARRSAEAGGRVMAHRPKVVPASEDQGP